MKFARGHQSPSHWPMRWQRSERGQRSEVSGVIQPRTQPIGTRHGAQTWSDYAGSCEATKLQATTYPVEQRKVLVFEETEKIVLEFP